MSIKRESKLKKTTKKIMREFGCSDCGQNPGEYHILGCDIERCPICEEQLLTCDHSDQANEKFVTNWDGRQVSRYKVRGSCDM